MNDMHLKPCPFCGWKYPQIAVSHKKELINPTPGGMMYVKESVSVYAWCDDRKWVNGSTGCGARAQGIWVEEERATYDLIESFKQYAAERWNIRLEDYKREEAPGENAEEPEDGN